MHSELIPRIASGFCSGMAHTAGMCGAVSGGVMSIGLVLGRSDPDVSLDPCYQTVQAFLGRFSERYHALSCLELTGVDLGTPAGQAEYRQKGQSRECAGYVGDAASWVVELLERP